MADAGKCHADKRAQLPPQRTEGYSRRAKRPGERDGLPPSQPEDVDRRDTEADRVDDEECADGARSGGTSAGVRTADIRSAEAAQPAVLERARHRGDYGDEFENSRRNPAQTGFGQ